MKLKVYTANYTNNVILHYKENKSQLLVKTRVQGECCIHYIYTRVHVQKSASCLCLYSLDSCKRELHLGWQSFALFIPFTSALAASHCLRFREAAAQLWHLGDSLIAILTAWQWNGKRRQADIHMCMHTNVWRTCKHTYIHTTRVLTYIHRNSSRDSCVIQCLNCTEGLSNNCNRLATNCKLPATGYECRWS